MIVCQLNSGKPKVRGRLPRVVVLAPTRELAIQVNKEFDELTDKLTTHCFYGGAPYRDQEHALRQGVDIVVGTCGRIDDLLEKKSLKFDNIQYIIMDEADEMLNMGFAEAVEKILSSVPRAADRAPVQTCLFSATLPSWVQNVAKKYLRTDATTRVDLVGDTGGKASTSVTHIAMPCHWSERNSILGECIMKYAGLKGRTIIFTETKKDANELVMATEIKQECQVLHGDISQAQRETTLTGFREVIYLYSFIATIFIRSMASFSPIFHNY
jgi:superfamily II DNA/RNA helicase